MLVVGLTSIIVFLVSILCFLFVLHMWKYRRYYYLGFKLPGPSLGEHVRILYQMLGSMEETTRVINASYSEQCSKNCSFYKFWIGPNLVVLLCDPNLVQEKYKHHLQKEPSFYRFIDTFGGGRSIFQENWIDKWRSHRKIIAGASLSFSSLKSFVGIFFQNSLILGEKLAQTGAAVEPVAKTTLASFAMIVRTMCGADIGYEDHTLEAHDFIDATETAFANVAKRIFKPWLSSDTIYAILGHQKNEIQNWKLGRDYVEKIIAKTKADLIAENEKPEDQQEELIEADSNQTGSLPNFVQVIIRDQLDPNIPDQNVISHDELATEITGILSAGFDTTRTANSIVLILLALHQNIQQNAFDEIRSVLGADPTIAPTYNQLQQLHILTRVIKEALRLFPTAPIIARHVDQDTEVDGYVVPRGASLITNIMGIHRDPRYWPHPNQFDPDRFLPSEVTKHHPNAYLPFSTGPRNCVGYKYAMLQMKTTISTILRRYKVLPGDRCKSMEDIRFEFGMTMVLLPGCDIRLEPRVK